MPMRTPRYWAWTVLLVALLFLMRGAATQAVEAQSSVVAPPAEQEPITPIPAVQPGDPLKVALGERLFADPRLSRDGTRACASCHDTRTNGADANGRATSIDGAALPFTTLT